MTSRNPEALENISPAAASATSVALAWLPHFPTTHFCPTCLLSQTITPSIPPAFLSPPEQVRSSIRRCLTRVSHRSPRQGASPRPFGTSSALAALGQLAGTAGGTVANAPEHPGQLELLPALPRGPRSSTAGPLPGVPGRGGNAAAAVPSVPLPFCNEQQWGVILI